MGEQNAAADEASDGKIQAPILRMARTTATSAKPNQATLDAAPSLSQYDIVSRAVQSQGGTARLSGKA
jgi:hypothetical protein